MTGTEYLCFSEDDKCMLTEDLTGFDIAWHKGDILELVYRDRFQEKLYFRNEDVKHGNRLSYGEFGPLTCLKAMSICRKKDSKPITKTTFEHKFNIGDTVWQMDCNKPKSHKIKRLEYIEDEKDNGDWSYVCDDGASFDDNCNIYGSKDELLDSLR